MSIQKVTLASLILFSLTACSSGGGGSSSPKADTAKENVVVKENQNAEKLKQLEADLTAAKQELAQAQQALANLTQQNNQTLADRQAIAEAAAKVEKIKKEIDDKERQEKEAEQALRDAQIKIQEEYKRQEQERQQKIAQLREKAMNAGLNEEEAQQFADSNYYRSNGIETDLAEKVAIKNGMDQSVAYEVRNYLNNQNITDEAKIKATFAKVVELDKLAKERNLYSYQISQLVRKNLDNLDNLDLDKLGFDLDYPLGLSVKSSSGVEGSSYYDKDFIYNQKYSAVEARYNVRSNDPNHQIFQKEYSISNYEGVKGNKLSIDSLPNEGKATYTGKAFHIDKQGELTYTIDFANKVGAGKISDLDVVVPEIRLKEGKIEAQGFDRIAEIRSDIETDKGLIGTYSLNFYGKQAEEIVGKIDIDSSAGHNGDPDSYARYKKHIESIEQLENAGFIGNRDYAEHFEIGIAGSRGEIEK